MDILGEDSDNEVKFTINGDYAKRYDRWRQGEELQKLKDKYGDNIESDSSTSDEDEDARELTKDIEKNFFKTLSCLKEKNPKIYDQNVRFFGSQPAEGTKKKTKKAKTDFMSVGEYQRKIILEKGGQFSDEEENDKSLKEMTNVEEEKAIKDSFKDVLKGSDSEDEKEGWGNLFTKRVKTKEELENEEEDYKLWLAGEKKKLKNLNEEQELKGLHDFWSDPLLDEDERFLRDYILNKRFLEKNEKNRIPAYDEVVHDSDSGLSADENTLEQQEEFERKYNFRFEEPDQEFIKRYPRTLEQSMRKTDDRRKRHREEVKARKEKEKAKKAEELKRLKVLKRREIMEKIKKLQEITGNDDIGFEKNDLEDDFDPDKHDKRMSQLFSDDYYGTCADEEKPEYPDLDKELEIENWDEYGQEGYEEEELHCEDPGFNMDCDYDPSNDNQLQKELVESSKKKKKRRQSKFAAAVAREKPVFDPKDKSFDKYIDEYYSLDYEDLIGDLPCRFKYRKVVPNDFGLSVEEILAAPDKELNRWVSVKKIMQRRPEHVELYDVKAYRKKAKDFNKKKKCLPTLYSNEMQEETDSSSIIKKNKDNVTKLSKKNSEKFSKEEPRNRLDDFDGFVQEPVPKKKKKLLKVTDKDGYSKTKTDSQTGEFEKKKSKKKLLHLSKNNNSEESVYNISDNRLKAYGINPKKLKNKLKYGKKVKS